MRCDLELCVHRKPLGLVAHRGDARIQLLLFRAEMRKVTGDACSQLLLLCAESRKLPGKLIARVAKPLELRDHGIALGQSGGCTLFPVHCICCSRSVLFLAALHELYELPALLHMHPHPRKLGGERGTFALLLLMLPLHLHERRARCRRHKPALQLARARLRARASLCGRAPLERSHGKDPPPPQSSAAPEFCVLG